MAKANFTKPASQVDLEARQAKDYESPAVLKKGSDPEPSENGYVGVDPIYQNYANDTDKPLQAEKGPEAKVEETFVAEGADSSSAATPQGEAVTQEDKEQQEPDKGNPPPSGPATPSN